MTHSIGYLADKLHQNRALAESAYRNLQILTELRDSAVHFYYTDAQVFEKRIHEMARQRLVTSTLRHASGSVMRFRALIST